MTRIAVVNDDTVFLTMMEAVLRDHGWETTAYREGHTAFAALKAEPPDLIILDIRLEEPEAGWTLLELLTLERRTRSVPVIVCSAALLDLRAHADILAQYDIRILPKPFDIDALYRCVEESLPSSLSS